MKKIFAILVVALFATTFVFANTYNATPYPATGTYNATIYCDPTVTGGTAINLMNYFVSPTPVPVNIATPQTFVLHGPYQATYKITWDGTNPLLAHTTYPNTGGTAPVGSATLMGTWMGTDGDGDFNADYNTTTGVYTPDDAMNIGCTSPAVTLMFTPTTITPTQMGTATFTINVYVTATI